MDIEMPARQAYRSRFLPDPEDPETGHNRQLLRARIKSAFSGSEAGAVRSLGALHRALDADAESAAGGSDFDPPRHWSDYRAEELETFVAVLPSLTVGSWRYYLPAFLYAALERLSLPVWETALPGAVLFNLTYAADDQAWSEKLLERFRSLDEPQAAAVRAFLEFACSNPHQEPLRGRDADKALRLYWRLPERSRSAIGARPADVRGPLDRPSLFGRGLLPVSRAETATIAGL